MKEILDYKRIFGGGLKKSIIAKNLPQTFASDKI
jgi:hypothetical protein